MFREILLITMTFIALDIIWFSLSVNPIYKPTILNIQKEPLEMKLLGGLFAWLLLAIGLYVFVLPLSNNLTNALIYGALYGFIVYGVYNGTNYAILKNYDLKVSLADLSWGIVVSTITAGISYKYIKSN